MFVSVCLCLSFQLSAATLSHCVTHAATAGSCPSVVVDGRRAPLKCLWGLIRCTTTQRTRPSTNIAFRRYVEQCATSMLLARAHVLVYVYLCVQMPTPRTLTHTHTHARTRTHTHTHTLSLSLADSFAVLFCYPGTEGRQALVADTIHIPQCARHACPNPSQRIHNHGPGCPACAGGRLQHGVAGGVLPLPLYNSTLAQTSHTHTHTLSLDLSLSLSLFLDLSRHLCSSLRPTPFGFVVLPKVYRRLKAAAWRCEQPTSASHITRAALCVSPLPRIRQSRFLFEADICLDVSSMKVPLSTTPVIPVGHIDVQASDAQDVNGAGVHGTQGPGSTSAKRKAVLTYVAFGRKATSKRFVAVLVKVCVSVCLGVSVCVSGCVCVCLCVCVSNKQCAHCPLVLIAIVFSVPRACVRPEATLM